MKSKTSMAHHNETIGSNWYLKSRNKSQEAIYIRKRHKKNRRTSGTFFDWLISQHRFNKELFLDIEDLSMITCLCIDFFVCFFKEVFFFLQKSMSKYQMNQAGKVPLNLSLKLNTKLSYKDGK